jgi:hypothetical protein
MGCRSRGMPCGFYTLLVGKARSYQSYSRFRTTLGISMAAVVTCISDAVSGSHSTEMRRLRVSPRSISTKSAGSSPANARVISIRYVSRVQVSRWACA